MFYYSLTKAHFYLRSLYFKELFFRILQLRRIKEKFIKPIFYQYFQSKKPIKNKLLFFILFILNKK